MLKRAASILISTSALALTSPAFANTSAAPIDIRAEPLGEALQDVARQAGIDLLFDHDAVDGLRAQPIRATLTPDAAIERLLQGTSLTLRHAEAGALIVERTAAAPLARQDVTVPEILVIGRRSQNADIRRLETDIQPYSISTGAQITEADRDSLDQYFRSRVPSDADAVPPSLDSHGATNSQIDLRGLGPDETLVLVDGRRMPGIPSPVFGFGQPDINPIPLHAVDRVEVLTGTAGGIYGFGALGGVVNVVLQRPQDGVQLHATGGITSRGDARELQLEGGGGFSPDGGATEVTLYVGAWRSQPLLTGERSYLTQDAKLSAELAPPDLFIGLNPNGNSILVSTTDFTQNLSLKPAYGGAQLGSFYSFLPVGSSGAPAAVAAALVRNAGQFDSSLSAGQAASGIGSNPETEALLANIRHKFDGGVELYLDAMMLWNQGEFQGYGGTDQEFLPSSSPANPFAQDIQILFPVPQASLTEKTSFDSDRYTLGAVAPLPFDWRGTAEVGLGFASYAFSEAAVVNAPETPPAPFGNWTDFQNAFAADLTRFAQSEQIENHFSDLSIRLAGPVFRTPAGPATLTLLAERRAEDVPGYTELTTIDQSTSPTPIASRATAVASFSAELRSRLFDGTAPSPLLRGLEVQLAARNDTETDDFARDPMAPDTTDRLHARFAATVYTAGAKVSPTSWLTLRASYATGRTPPPLADLIQTVIPNSDFVPANDPQRGNNIVSNVIYKTGGSHGLQTIQAETASLGGILSPFGEDGPRLTVDYSRIRKTGDVFIPSAQLVLDHENVWPQRVTRGPLTAADRALGYTAGPITMIDASAANGVGLNVDTVDVRLEWRRPLLGGAVRLYGGGTYYLGNVQTAPFQADVDRVDYLDNPLQLRANAGVDWTFGSVKIGANVQYFGGYRIVPPGEPADLVVQAASLQGSLWVPSQTYVDLHASWRHRLDVAGLSQDVKIDFGVIDLFDTAPPRESSYALDSFSPSSNFPGYSRYGDPRRRRFVLALSSAF